MKKHLKQTPIWFSCLEMINPKKKVTMRTRVSFYSPLTVLKGFIRYQLQVVVEYEISHKRSTRVVKAEELRLKFNSNDHPDTYEYCMNLIRNVYEKNLEKAGKRYRKMDFSALNPEIPDEIGLLRL